MDQQIYPDRMLEIDHLIPPLTIEKSVITIVLLGKTGVGKSTFINAFVNYIFFEKMNDALGQPLCLIPVSFTISDPITMKPVTVEFGEQDKNENNEDMTKAQTKCPKCYTFQNNNIVLNIIDTPGIADTAGVERDNENMQNILNFISNYEEINAFCVLLKPNEPRVDVVFKYCLFQLFTHLNKSAANNILFLFTNSRSTSFMPGETGPVLVSMLEHIRNNPPYVNIEYDPTTLYCFDSECFRYLVASVTNKIQFDSQYKSSYFDSWKRSVNECKRLFKRIKDLPAHKMMDTLSLNNAKQCIQLLIKPMIDIKENIADNIRQCEQFRIKIKDFNGTIEECKKKLTINKVELISVALAEPTIACSHPDCCTEITVDGVTDKKYHMLCGLSRYYQFDDNYISGKCGNFVSKPFKYYRNFGRESEETSGKYVLRLVTLPATRIFEFINNCSNCVCGHKEQHLLLKYNSEKIVKKIIDSEMTARIKSATTDIEVKEINLQANNKRLATLNAESQTITESMSLFSRFLANNSLTPVSDAFENYVNLIIAEKQLGVYNAETEREIAHLKQKLTAYGVEKEMILTEMVSSSSDIAVEEIDSRIKQICQLSHSGTYIRNLLDELIDAKTKYHFDNYHVVFKGPNNAQPGLLDLLI